MLNAECRGRHTGTTQQAAGSTRFAVVALSAHPRLLGINSIGTDTASVFFFSFSLLFPDPI